MILMFVAPSLFGKALQSKQNALSEEQAVFTGKIKDMFSGYEVIRSFHIYRHINGRFDKQNADLASVKFASDKLFVAYLLITGDITAGTLVALVQLGSFFVQPMMMVIQNIPKIKGIVPVIKRLDDFAEYKDTDFTGTIEPSFERQIAVKQLEFSYNDDKKTIDSIDFIFEKGKKYAIVGESGCGKTTLTKILMGYFFNYEGSVQLDNNEIRQLDAGGLDYELGENGKNLSGGQRQRIAIARALIKKTPVLILDEGTSSIDMQTAYDIESSLLAINDLTLITITHKMSQELLGMYDTIIFMDEGKIIKSGHFNEMLSKQSEFYEFFHLKNDKK
ncbi:atp-binding cassette sub-family b [Holotrichia oblita]|nr:atp-binding cassette sub-family b [Holotrichia oblita]